MFEFFEKIVEGIGFKLINDFSDKVYDWIKEVRTKAENSTDENNIATSGYNSKVATSGNYSKVATSGYNSKVATSGYNSKVATSGDDSQVATSGNYSQVATSGNYSQVDISGDNSVGFACGWKSIIKAKKGTWISLCEWSKNDEDKWIPIYALSAQIGNKEYKDFRGRILKEDEFYCLCDKKFYPVDISDGIKIKKMSEKKKDNITIIKGTEIYDDEEIYLVKQDDLSAHGETLKEALEDLQFKKLKSEETQEIVAEIRRTKKVTKAQYRAITGACQFGTNKFCEEHNITEEEIELDELRKILINDYGAEKFWSLIDKD